MRVGLIGVGYWGSIIKRKLVDPIQVVFEADSKTDYSKLLGDIDWAIVASPNHSHFEIVKSCLEAGVHVCCEKPLTGNPEQSRKLIELSKQVDKHLYTNNIFLKRNVFTKFLHQIENQDLTSLSFSWLKYGPFNGSLYDDLLYHDLYLSETIVANKNAIEEFEIIDVTDSEDSLTVNYRLAGIDINCHYDRKHEGDKTKIISTDQQLSCNFSDADNDPLNETIQDLLFNNKSIDFSANHEITLVTEKRLLKIKQFANPNYPS